MKPTFWVTKIIQPSWNSLSHFPNPRTWTTLSHLSNLFQLSLTLVNILFKVSNGWTSSQQCILYFSVSHLVLIFLFSVFLAATIIFFFFFFFDVLNWDKDSHDVMTDVLCCNVAWGKGAIFWLLSLMCFVLVLLYLMNLLLWFL